MTSTTTPIYKNAYLSTPLPDCDFAPLASAIKPRFDAILALPVPEMRAAFSTDALPAFPEGTPIDLDIQNQMIELSDGAKIELRVYRKEKQGKGKTMFFVSHGGGWVLGSHEVEEMLCRWVAGEGAVVVSVDYRLAPEHKYPGPLNDCFEALQWCMKYAATLGIDSKRIILGGSSSGGNLTAALAQKVRDEGIEGVIGQAINIPVTCNFAYYPNDKYELNSHVQNADAPMMTTRVIQTFWDNYLQHPGQGKEPYASPLLATSFKGLPPALIQVAGLDPLRDEGLAYAEALRADGVSVRLQTYQGLPHGFSLIPGLKKRLDTTKNTLQWIQDLENGKL